MKPILLVASSACLAIQAAAESSSVYADSPWLRARSVAIAQTAAAELEGHRAFFAELGPRLEAAFAGAPTGSVERERTLKRHGIALDACEYVAAEIARGTDDGWQFAERVLDDLWKFRAYFEEELQLWKTNPLNPAVKPTVVELPAVKPDEDAAKAFDACLDEVRKLGGQPCVVKVPSGIYNFRTARPSCGNGSKAQVLLEALTNVLVTGVSPVDTKFVFHVYDASGGVLDNCENVTLRNFEVYWARNPFSEGMVEEVDPDEGSCVMKMNPLGMRPDDLGLAGALGCQFDRNGKIDFEASWAWKDPNRPAKDLGDGRFRVYFNREKFGDGYRRVKVGKTICFPHRNNAYHGFRLIGGRFVTLDTIWFRNSRAAAFSTGRCHQTTGVRCRIFPQDGCVLSTCADGYYSSSGSYFAHCDFTNMHDDANNSHSNGLYLEDQPDANTLVFKGNNGRPKRGDLMLLVSPLTGRYLGNVRVAEDAVRTNHNGAALLAVRFESLPGELATFRSLGMNAFTQKEQEEIIFGRKKVDRMPDHIYVPGLDGVMSVVFDCRLSSMRNVALPIQCPHELVEGNLIENVSMGVHLCALVQWMEGPPPYHTVIRGNVIKDCGLAIRSFFQMPNHNAAEVAPMRGIRIEDNEIVHPRRGAMSFQNLGYSAICDNVVIGCGVIEARECSDMEVHGNIINGEY